MEPHAVQSNNIICNIPKQGVNNTINTEPTVADERKTDKEFSSYTDKMRIVYVSAINEEVSSEVVRISSAGSQVRCLKKKLLVLDINGLLADIVYPPPNDHNADATIAMKAIFKRPFYLEFLKFCFENFEVGVWSTRSERSLEQLIDFLMGDMKNDLLFCWDRSHCTATNFKKPENKHMYLLFKDLKKIWEKHDPNLPWEKGYYNESNTLLLDDSPYKALLNPRHTSVFPHAFNYQKKTDNSLAAGGDLREYLDGLAKAENMSNYVEEHPFGQEGINETNHYWSYYLQVIASLSSGQPAENLSVKLE